jgi:shikimate dehydrogenase
VFAVLGDPVAHSLSPPMQNAAFEAAGIDGIYVALRAGAERFAGLMRGLASAGGGGNVTLPHKARALAEAERAGPAARRTGAANTFWWEAGELVADNTDVDGVRRALEVFQPGAPRDQRVLLLGAGGAARAAAVALLDGGAARVVVRNRTPDRARELVELLDDDRLRVARDDGASADLAADLVVNATRLGLRSDDPLPLDRPALADTGARAVFDVVYGSDPEGTAWVVQARAMGLAATDGREMLLQQGARAFELWWQREAPLDAMRAALAGGPDVG